MRKKVESPLPELRVSARPTDLSERSQIVRAGLREQVTEHLLAAVFEGRFASGEHLVVQKLSEKLGVSPTPVRESLVELEGLGVVELVPHRGAVVQAFGRHELQEMVQVRRVLEAEAARCAFGHVPAAVLAELKVELEALDSLEASESRDRRARDADTMLHLLVCDNCGNKRLAAEVRKYLTLFRALRNVSHLRDSWNNYRHSNDVPEHLEIVKAFLTANAAAAHDAMYRHLESVENTLMEVLFGNPA